MADKKKPAFQPPQPLSEKHDLSQFNSGEPSLDDWLRRRSLANESSGASRTYVVTESTGKRVVAYYSLAAGAVAHSGATGKARRNMPDPIPVMVLARLAVDQSHQGNGLGSGLLRDAILRTLQAASIAGIRALLVHAISPAARAFYERHGFRPSPVDPLMLMITLSEAEKAIGN